MGGAVSAAEAVRLINREKAVLIDVQRARRVRRRPCRRRAQRAAERAGQRQGAAHEQGLPLVVMCATGARSSRAAAQLRKAGFANVHALAGGNAAWREASLPIEKSA